MVDIELDSDDVCGCCLVAGCGEVGVLKDGGKSEGAKHLAGVEVQHHNR